MPTYRDIYLEKDEAPANLRWKSFSSARVEDEAALSLADFDDEQ